MNKQDRAELVKFGACMARMYVPHAASAELLEIAQELHRIDEANCNTEPTKRRDARERSLETRASEIAHENGVFVSRQGDPRGCPLYVGATQALADQQWGVAVYVPTF